jgi:formate dehydrogenase iron-sulfur subunit
MSKACLIDTTRCIGCRSCQVACKQWNGLPVAATDLEDRPLGLQNPKSLSARNFCILAFHEVEDPEAPGGMRFIGVKRQCMHCLDPACVSACPVTALHKTPEGPVVYDGAKCLGCRYCVWACPFGVPTAEWDSLAPEIKKCTMCFDRLGQSAPPPELNGAPLGEESQGRLASAQVVPACVKACPTGALKFGERDDLVEEGWRRIRGDPGRYTPHIYGEKEAGGTGVLYLSALPFDQIGFRTDLGERPYPAPAAVALSTVPPTAVGLGVVLGGIYRFIQRRRKLAKDGPAVEHVEFEPLRSRWLTPWGVLLALLMLAGMVAFVARFALGLGGSTNLSDTYPWGLWIVFDLVWIAVAAGAFAMAAAVYVFHRKDFYPIGRSAVLMGLLSYSFVLITLLADLGLPWHFWQLAVQVPEHSAMFEVSWCVALYVTILALEFAPAVLERFSFRRLAALWRILSPWYVAAAMTLFVFLMSRSAVWTVATLVAYTALVLLLRQPAHEKPVPIMLAIAAVTLSTMHQSSLGSLFLLMPDKLDPLWWSPFLPLVFFLSSIASGVGLVVLMVAFIDKVYRRPRAAAILPKMGALVFWSLLVYLVVRIGDVILRGHTAGMWSSPNRFLFLAEILLGGLLPLLLLARRRLRERPGLLLLGCALTVGGVIFNRANVVIFGMSLHGPAPGVQPASYFPSLIEIAVTVSLLAATFFIFALASKLMPVLSKTAKSGEA